MAAGDCVYLPPPPPLPKLAPATPKAEPVEAAPEPPAVEERYALIGVLCEWVSPLAVALGATLKWEAAYLEHRRQCMLAEERADGERQMHVEREEEERHARWALEEEEKHWE